MDANAEEPPSMKTVGQIEAEVDFGLRARSSVVFPGSTMLSF